MATAVFETKRDDGYILVEWSSLLNGETGNVARIGHIAGVKTIAITGTFDGETVAVQGSMDKTNWFPLHAANFTASDYEELTAVAAARQDAIVDNPLWVRPVVSGGAGAPDLKIIIGGNSRL